MATAPRMAALLFASLSVLSAAHFRPILSSAAAAAVASVAISASAASSVPGCGAEDGECHAANAVEEQLDEEVNDMEVRLLQHRSPSMHVSTSDDQQQQEVEEFGDAESDAAIRVQLQRDGCPDPSPECCTQCQLDIQWAKYTGWPAHPDWYPGLNQSSTDAEYVAILAKHGHCTMRCHADGTSAEPPFPSVVKMEPFIGIGYTPDPHKWTTAPACDDFMADWSEPLWGPSGRNDLKVIKEMGATVVRTYGIASHLNHWNFLEHAKSLGLKVMPGFADFPFLRRGSACGQQHMNLITNCLRDWQKDCFSMVKQQYRMMLENGYTYVDTEGVRRYHPAILTVTLINECELKMYGFNSGNIGEGAWHAKIVVSAADGLLAAEEELGIQGPKPLLTATVSLATCPRCKSVGMNFPGCHARAPTLCTLADYYFGFMDPEGFLGYHAQHNMTEMYRTRWVNSYNTPRPADEICEAGGHIIKEYSQGPLRNVPIYIAEFHNSFESPQQFKNDILKARSITLGEDNGLCGVEKAPLVGFNLFEYAVAYWKGSHSEGNTGMRYGMWGVGNRYISKTHWGGGAAPQNVYCIFPARIGGAWATKWDDTNAKAAIEALGGKWPEWPVLC